MMKLNNTLKNILAIAMCLSLVAVSTFFYTPKASAESVDQLKEKYSSLEQKVSDSEKRISELEKEKAGQEKIIDALNQQLSQLSEQLENIQSQKQGVSAQIDEAEAKIADLNSQIDQLNADIEEKNQEIDATVQLFCQRMRANYMAGDTTILEMFTNSSNVANFLNRVELFKRVTQSDQKLVDDLNDEIASIEAMQKQLEESKTELQGQKVVLEGKKSDLQVVENELNSTQESIEAKSAEVEEKLKSINYETQELNVSVEEYNETMESLERQIQNAINNAKKASQNNSGSNSSSDKIINGNVSGGWMWPVPDSTSYVSSSYGYRSDPATGVTKYHSGLDITCSAAYGKPLVATRAGTVILTDYMSGGYGNYIMIDHGDGFVSLYGHCSSLAASYGQYVKQGQVIAYIGASGYATGPHVHFEIRYNGEKVNPYNYISKG